MNRLPLPYPIRPLMSLAAPSAGFISGRMVPRGPLTDEHTFRIYGSTDPEHMRGGRYGITVECSCGTRRVLDAGHTDLDLIRLACNEAGIT